MLNVTRTGTINTSEPNQIQEQEAPSVISSIAQETLTQQQEEPTALIAQVTVLDQLDEVRKKEALGGEKNQLIQILNSILEKDTDCKYHELINHMIDIINNLDDCDPETVKYAFADFLKSDACIATFKNEAYFDLKYLSWFLSKHDLSDLKDSLTMAIELAIFFVGWRFVEDIPTNFSLNDLKYLAAHGAYHQVLSIINTGNYVLMGTEFRDFAVSIVEKIKNTPDSFIPHDLLLTIAKSYAKECDLRAIEYVKEVIKNYFGLYLFHRSQVYSIGVEFLRNEKKLSAEEVLFLRDAFFAALLPTPDSMSFSFTENRDRIMSSSLKIPMEMHHRILSFADARTLGNLAQTNMTDAKIAYDSERKHFLEFLTLIIKVSRSPESVIEFYDIKDKVENIPNCDLDKVKYIIVKYLSIVNPVDLNALKLEVENRDLGRLKNVFDLALVVSGEKTDIPTRAECSVSDLQFLHNGFCSDSTILKYMRENNLITKRRAFKNFAVYLIGCYDPERKQRLAELNREIFLTLAETYAEEGDFNLALQNTKAVITKYNQYCHYQDRIYSIAKKFFNNKQLSSEDRMAYGSAFLAALLPTPSSLYAIRDSSQVDQRSSFFESMPPELHSKILHFGESKALGNLAQTSVQEANRVYVVEKERILSLLNAFSVFLQKFIYYKVNFYEINDLIVKVTNSACDFDDVKHIAIKYLLGISEEDLFQLKENTKQLDCGRFNNIIDIALLIKKRQGSAGLELSIDDLKFLEDEFSLYFCKGRWTRI